MCEKRELKIRVKDIEITLDEMLKEFLLERLRSVVTQCKSNKALIFVTCGGRPLCEAASPGEGTQLRGENLSRRKKYPTKPVLHLADIH